MLDREGLQRIHQRRLADFVASPPRAQDARYYALRSTSGTTGSGPMVFMSRFSPLVFRRYKESKRVLLCFGSMNGRLSNSLFARNDPREDDPRTLALDMRDLGPQLPVLLAQFAPDNMTGFVSFVAKVSEFMDEPTRGGVLELNLQGEKLTQVMEHYITERFPNAKLVQGLTISEVGVISGPSCGYLPFNRYHPALFAKVELINIDEEGVGELLVGWRGPDGFAIEQYQTGDVARFIEGSCPCGATITFEMHGRTGLDYIELSGATLRREEFDRALAKYAWGVADYRADASMERRGEHLKGKIELRIYPTAQQDKDTLRMMLEKSLPQEIFVTPTKKIVDLVQSGLFVPMRVEIVNEPFPYTHKSIKLRYQDV